MSSNLIGQTLYRRYRVEQFLGSGGMGVVYKVWDTRANVHLAAKVLNSDLIDDEGIRGKFKREANALKKLQHPHILRFFGYFESGDSPFLVMQYIDGLSLKDLLKSSPNRRMPVEEALVYLKAVSAALGYAHAYGVVHCDVKPGNVMVDRGGGIYLADFGIARHADSTVTTRLGGMTTAYASPEQCRLEKVLTPASDVYSLAVMFYEMVAGRRPFELKDAGTESGVLNTGEYLSHAHRHLEPPDPRQHNPALSEELAQVILTALAKDPAERFESVHAFFEETARTMSVQPGAILDRVQEIPVAVIPRTTITASPVTLMGAAPAQPLPRNWGTYAAIIGLAAVAVGGLALAGVFRGAESSIPEPAAEILAAEEPTVMRLPTATPLPTATTPPIPTDTPTLEPTLTASERAHALAAAGVTRNADWAPYIEEINGVPMALVPAGCFMMGSTSEQVEQSFAICKMVFGADKCRRSQFEAEQPMHLVCFDEPFWIDVHEVTNAQFAALGGQAGRGSRQAEPDRPRESITWTESVAFCELRMARLPTEAEWEYAARGPDGLVYPWGNTFDGTRLNFCDVNCAWDWADYAVDDGYAHTAPVGMFASGVSWVGVLDMSGNVWEWVSDQYSETYYGTLPEGAVSPQGPASGEYRVLRGGSWVSFGDYTRSAIREWYSLSNENGVLGFRCARNFGALPIADNLSPTALLASPTPAQTIFVVDASSFWQSTGVMVSSWQLVRIEYVSGSWTTWEGGHPYVDADGNVNLDDPRNANHPVPSAYPGVLIAKVAQGVPQEVGNSRELIFNESGVLYLQINDDYLSDNNGAITVRITVEP